MSTDKHAEITFTPEKELDSARHMTLSPFGLPGCSMHAYRGDSGRPHETDPTPQADAVMPVILLKPNVAHRVWQNGHANQIAAAPFGEIAFFDLREIYIAEVKCAFHTAHLLLPNAIFGRRNGSAKRGSPTWNFDPGMVRTDQVLKHLFLALMPSLDTSGGADRLFVDHVAEAISVHISERYEVSWHAEPVNGRILSSDQVRKAKDLLLSRISGNVSLQEVADLCEISLDYFGASFKRTVGLSPYRWLTLQRIDRAQAMLRSTSRTLVEIAMACGFGSQSHFTDAFKRATGIPPGEWRRLANG